MKQKEKIKAVKLRKAGWSLNEIADALGISKSTASVWCKDVAVTGKAKKRLCERTKAKSVAGLQRYADSLRTQKAQAITQSMQKGSSVLGELTDRDVYCIGLGLYWGEGYKKGNQEFGFTNSDPAMILFYLRWLQVVFGIPKDRLVLRLSINVAHKARIEKVLQFWSRLTNIPLHQFTKTSYVQTKSKKLYLNMDTHMGTLRVKVRKGTSLRREVLGAIETFSSDLK